MDEVAMEPTLLEIIVDFAKDPSARLNIVSYDEFIRVTLTKDGNRFNRRIYRPGISPPYSGGEYLSYKDGVRKLRDFLEKHL